MSGENSDSDFALVPRPSEELSAARATEVQIVREMVEVSLAIARESGPSLPVDVGALLRAGKRLYEAKKGMTAQNIRAFNFFREAAIAGNLEAQSFLSRCYWNGDGVEANASMQIEWLLRSAEGGFRGAQCDLGHLILNTAIEDVPNAEIGKTGNFVESIKWLRKAAEQGDASAQYVLGVCYQEGKGVSIEFAESVKWLRRAAEQGHLEAQHSLAWCYVDSDKSEHVKWLNRAAEQGHYKAQARLSIILYMGDYLPEEQQDIVEAYKWDRIMAETVDPAEPETAAVAASNLSDKKAWMRPEQVERAEYLAGEFLARAARLRKG
jgi:TPR repeat protein